MGFILDGVIFSIWGVVGDGGCKGITLLLMRRHVDMIFFFTKISLLYLVLLGGGEAVMNLHDSPVDKEA